MQRATRRLVCGCLALIAVGFSFTAASAADDAASQVVQSAADKVTAIVKDTTGEQREAAIQAVMKSSFDMNYMGRAALGTHWERATEEQRQRFLRAAVLSEAHAYSERFGQYGGQKLALGKTSARAGGVSIVDSKLTQPNGQPISILWEVRDAGQGMRITDVKIEGVSMVMTRRSDFNSYIQGKGGQVEPLIQELENRARK